MKATELERLVIRAILSDAELKPIKAVVNFDAVTVCDREFTGLGFLTEFERSEELRLFDNAVSLRWGKIGARLNTSKLETGYLVYIDGGYLTTIEGYTYGDGWPSVVDQIETYELKPGMELTVPRA